jgi:hypothetical protein
VRVVITAPDLGLIRVVIETVVPDLINILRAAAVNEQRTVTVPALDTDTDAQVIAGTLFPLMTTVPV